MRCRLLACALVCAASAAGCTSAAELHRAETSAYKADFAVVYGQTLAAVRKLYPTLSENASAGVIKTAWHPLTIQQDEDTARAPMVNTTNPSTFSENEVEAVQYFVRFDVYVVGGNPWRIRVVGQASRWEAGQVPMRLHGADEPHWLKGRTDALEVAIYKRLKKYAVPIAQVKARKAQKRQALDTSRYHALPPAAAQRIAQVLAAAKKGDPAGLRPYLSGDFAWSLGGTGSADEAIAMWRADRSVLGELVKVLEAGCRSAGKRITCPPSYARGNGFAGYRAGFARVGGDWKMIFFLTGQ